MFSRVIVLALLVLLMATPALAAQQFEGEYLYQVTTVRADAGKLAELLACMAGMKASSYFQEAGDQPPLVMRHSQGDQWDLLIISPMESWAKHHSQGATNRREKAQAKFADEISMCHATLAFTEDHFAHGPPLPVIKSAYDGNAFFHIEMFEAEAGKVEELLKQRRMENVYLAATGQKPNMIFRRAGGSDVDVFTIGFYKSLETFAAPAPVTDEEKEVAARAAGFENLADISFYLRSLISGHHDTLAVKVK
jgi:hypothetical protein